MKSVVKKQKPPDNQLELAIPAIFTPSIILPGPREGEWLIKPGKPQVLSDEIGTREAAKLSGYSQRHLCTLCDEGIHLQQGRDWRRANRPRSKYFIRRSAIMALIQGDLSAPSAPSAPSDKSSL